MDVLLRDLGAGPLIFGLAVIGLLVYSVAKGGSKGGKGGSSSSSSSSSSSTPTPPTE